MNSGLAALLGAIVGGGLTAGSSVWLESLRHRRAIHAEGRRDARDLRRAARLVLDELAHSMATIDVSRKGGKWTAKDARELKYNRWVAHQQTLADHLPDEHWAAVGDAYELLYLTVDATGESTERIPPEAYQKLFEVVPKAIGALRTYARSVDRQK